MLVLAKCFKYGDLKAVVEKIALFFNLKERSEEIFELKN